MATRREMVDCPFMEPYQDGSFVATSKVGYAWRCDDCGLVWDRKHYAENCGRRQHVAHWRRGYGATMILNGVPNYKGFIEVDAIRRESLNALCPPNDPELVKLYKAQYKR